MRVYDVLIVGAGPAGLAAAIAASKAGLDYQVIEKGCLVNNLFHFPTHMVFFTTPELLEIGGLPFVTPYEKPTRLEALRYYRRVVEFYDLQIALDEEVVRVEPGAPGPDGARTLIVETRSVRGVRRPWHGRTVVLAVGCYDHPNQVGVPGEDLPHVSHYYKEAHPFHRKPVVVVGGKNSAAEAALELYRAGARVTLVHRRPTLSDSIKYWVRPDIENRIKAGSIAARLNTRVAEIRPISVLVEHDGAREEIPADAVFLLTGYHADSDLLRRAGVTVDPDTCAPQHDPDTFETDVPGVFIIGSAVSGRQSGKIFIENGRFHGDRVIERIRERLAPA